MMTTQMQQVVKLEKRAQELKMMPKRASVMGVSFSMVERGSDWKAECLKLLPLVQKFGS